MVDDLPSTIKSELMKLGFSDYEVRTYIALLRENPTTAYQISKNANIPRANAYSVLDGLSRKNAVQAVSKEPVRFVPVAPDVLFRQIANETHERCNHLMNHLSQLEPSDNTEAVWNLEGQKKIDAKITEIISSAEMQIWIKADCKIIERYEEELQDAAGRGVSLLIILFGADHDPFEFGSNSVVLLHEGNGVRMGDADNMFTMATDFKTTLTANVMGPPVAAYTQSRPIVTISESLIRHDMYLAEIFTKFGDQIDKEFGPHLYKLRSRYFSDAQMVRFTKTMSEHPDWAEDLNSRPLKYKTTAKD